MRALLRQLPGLHHGQDALAQAPHARPAQSPVRRREESSRQSGCATEHARRGAASAEAARRSRRERWPSREIYADRSGARRHPPDVLWACTTCRACEEQCPVMITLRRQDRADAPQPGDDQGRVPAELAEAVQGHGDQRQPVEPVARRSRQLGRRPGHPDARREARRRGAVLGRLRRQLRRPRQEDRARDRQAAAGAPASTSRSSATEETCTGDPARRAGNEYLFAMLAETNVATLNGYKEQGGKKKIVTTCPHCFNTLRERVPRLRRASSRSCTTPTSCSAWSPRRSSAPSKPVDGQGRLPRLLLPRPLQRRLRLAARDPASASPASSCVEVELLEQEARACAAAPAARRCSWKSRTRIA